MKMAMVNIDSTLPPPFVVEQLSGNLTALLPCLSVRSPPLLMLSLNFLISNFFYGVRIAFGTIYF